MHFVRPHIPRDRHRAGRPDVGDDQIRRSPDWEPHMNILHLVIGGVAGLLLVYLALALLKPEKFS